MTNTLPKHIIHGAGHEPVEAEVGMRVAKWNAQYGEPVAGTITRIGLRYVTVALDDGGELRIWAHRLQPAA